MERFIEASRVADAVRGHSVTTFILKGDDRKKAYLHVGEVSHIVAINHSEHRGFIIAANWGDMEPLLFPTF